MVLWAMKTNPLFTKGHHLESEMEAVERKVFLVNKTEKSSFLWRVRELPSNEEKAGQGNNLDLKGTHKEGRLQGDEYLKTRPSSEGSWNRTAPCPQSPPNSRLTTHLAAR